MDALTIATAALAAITFLLVAVGTWQALAIRKESRLERTLVACNRYEADVVVERCVRRLRSARTNERFAADPKAYQHDVIMVLNYLDTIAIGVQQRLYDENLAYDHTSTIVQFYFETYLSPEMAKQVGIVPREYDRLCRMAQRWSNVKPRFRRGWTWWRID
jgi:hypothetical protein